MKKKLSAESLEIAEELNRLPEPLRAKVRDAVLRIVLTFQVNHARNQAQLTLPLRGKTRVEGNLLRPQVEAWKARPAPKRRRS